MKAVAVCLMALTASTLADQNRSRPSNEASADGQRHYFRQQAELDAAAVGQVAADIEQLVSRVDPDLNVEISTNDSGVIRYKVALKDWSQHDAIYAALNAVKKLSISSVKEPPSVTIALDESCLLAPPSPPQIVTEQPKAEPQPDPVHLSPEPQPAIFPLLTLAGFVVLGFVAIMVVAAIKLSQAEAD